MKDNKRLSYSTRIEHAIKDAPRALFLPDNVKADANLDIPLPIGYGQTNSQPSTVKQMLEWLEVKEGDKVLDVGCGSGWTTALLAYLTGENGYVFGVERIEQLADLSRKNLKAAGVKNAEVLLSKDGLGVPEELPFDRILVSASAGSLPQSLVNQLAIGGRMVIPVKNSICIVERTLEGVDTKQNAGYVFVPLITDDPTYI